MECIIDDGLLIRGNELLSGYSAKKEPTKLVQSGGRCSATRNMRARVREAILRYQPESILILGTSDKMVAEIAKTLAIEPIVRTIRIEEVATEERDRKGKKNPPDAGKHVIPVPTFEIKKGFFGRTARHAAYF